MPAVFSKLATSPQWVAMAALMKKWAATYMQHRTAVGRCLLLLFVLRTALSIHKAVSRFKKEQKKPRQSLSARLQTSDKSSKRKVEV